ncbi:hypothetical protein MMC30_007504 [Trapelia coarctata]|nr:hypothetical protein [Trapelia coarctata]
MPLILESHDSLPYIDADPTPSTRAQISALVNAELSPAYTTEPHPLLPSPPSPKFSPLISAELARIAAKESLNAIDTTRYEALEPPASPDPTSDETRPQLLEEWRSALRKAYTSSTYLSNRLQNLALLDQFGKNAWLVGNSQLEEILKGIEKELVEARGEVEAVEADRRAAQEGVEGEMEGLDEGWRKGVGRLVEVLVAGEEVRHEILDRRREGAV